MIWPHIKTIVPAPWFRFVCACIYVLQVLVQVELDKICQRIEDLRKQVVTSPDKLRAVSQIDTFIDVHWDKFPIPFSKHSME